MITSEQSPDRVVAWLHGTASWCGWIGVAVLAGDAAAYIAGERGPLVTGGVWVGIALAFVGIAAGLIADTRERRRYPLPTIDDDDDERECGCRGIDTCGECTSPDDYEPAP